MATVLLKMCAVMIIKFHTHTNTENNMLLFRHFLASSRQLTLKFGSAEIFLFPPTNCTWRFHFVAVAFAFAFVFVFVVILHFEWTISNVYVCVFSLSLSLHCSLTCTCNTILQRIVCTYLHIFLCAAVLSSVCVFWGLMLKCYLT